MEYIIDKYITGQGKDGVNALHVALIHEAGGYDMAARKKMLQGFYLDVTPCKDGKTPIGTPMFKSLWYLCIRKLLFACVRLSADIRREAEVAFARNVVQQIALTCKIHGITLPQEGVAQLTALVKELLGANAELAARMDAAEPELPEVLTFNRGFEDTFRVDRENYEELLESGAYVRCKVCFSFFTANHLIKNPNSSSQELCPYCGRPWADERGA